MLITPEYAEQNAALHRQNELYGTSGYKKASDIINLINNDGSRTLLDYGCGKATLATALDHRAEEIIEPLFITNYDPAIAEYAARPKPCDLVVCGDVLEHIEPDCLDEVLADIKSLTLQHAYFIISLIPAQKYLPDGRNAHLIIETAEWWTTKLEKEWEIWITKQTEKELRLLCAPRSTEFS